MPHHFSGYVTLSLEVDEGTSRVAISSRPIITRLNAAPHPGEASSQSEFVLVFSTRRRYRTIETYSTRVLENNAHTGPVDDGRLRPTPTSHSSMLMYVRLGNSAVLTVESDPRLRLICIFQGTVIRRPCYIHRPSRDCPPPHENIQATHPRLRDFLAKHCPRSSSPAVPLSTQITVLYFHILSTRRV